MKIAYVHILPLEYYPPATNTIKALAAELDYEVAVWSSENLKQRPVFKCPATKIERPPFVKPADSLPKRLLSWIRWNWQCARSLKRFSPDALISIEPHSALAVWIFYKILGGKSRLFIHHHEYYAPKDYEGAGMRFVKIAKALEQKCLFPKAEWISQTNENRLKFMQQDNPTLSAEKFKVWPNYPPKSWLRPNKGLSEGGPLRLVYLGSASFHDTYIREVVEWVAQYPEKVELTVSGYNIDPKVWEWLGKKSFPNVQIHPDGWTYEELPQQLGDFDVGLILYKGNTINFVYNAPNKLFEYWACGLVVWYPQEMKQITELANSHTTPPLMQMDFTKLNPMSPPEITNFGTNYTEYSCEAALAPLIRLLS